MMAPMRVNEVGGENGEEKLTVLIKDNLRISKKGYSVSNR